MERSTTVMMIKNINGRLSQQQQTPQKQTMEPYISFPQKPSLRNASFSSYHRPNHHQQDHHKIINEAADDSEISIFDAQKYFNETNNVIDSKVIRVSPVNVINNLERISEHRISSDVLALPRFSSSSSVDNGYGRNYNRIGSFNATPTASSEASWNSQTGLLSNPPGAIAVSMRSPATEEKKRGSSASRKWQFFGRKCPCSGKKSVQVEEKASSEPKTPASRLYNRKEIIQKSIEIPVEKSFPDEEIVSSTRRISAENRFTGLGQRVIASSGRSYDAPTGFTFPILNQTSSMKLVLNNLSSNTNNTIPIEEPPRESLEIFQPPSEELQNRVVVSRESFTFPASPGRTRMTSITDDDVASDASSDLFEIESFSTSQTISYPMYSNNHRRDSLDEAASFNARRLAATTNGNNNIMFRSPDEPVLTPSIAATECYEPSEASIDWSVTTAEGFDRGSVTNFSVTASEVDDMAVMMRHENNGGGGKKKGNSSGGMLLSCRCEKAVSVVGPNPVKCVAGSGMRHVSSRTCNVNYNKPPLARSQSHTLSLPFAS